MPARLLAQLPEVSGSPTEYLTFINGVKLLNFAVLLALVIIGIAAWRGLGVARTMLESWIRESQKEKAKNIEMMESVIQSATGFQAHGKATTELLQKMQEGQVSREAAKKAGRELCNTFRALFTAVGSNRDHMWHIEELEQAIEEL